MVIENTRIDAMEKPWGRADLGPWQQNHSTASAIGELWFSLPQPADSETALLLKLLFTAQPLSIQVHPDDAAAHLLGLRQGKTEAWVVLSASAEAKIALGLTRILQAPELRAAIQDGSIADLVDWRPAAVGDVIFVPAGTIHALGAGLVVLEVQQRSDTTFRLFDFGRGRQLDVENAVACAIPHSAGPGPVSSVLSAMRTLLVANACFVLEFIDLPAFSLWEFSTQEEIWIYGVQGYASFGEIDLAAGQAIFAARDSAALQVGAEGLKCLAAYAADRPCFNLLRSTTSEPDLEFAEFLSGMASYAAANPRIPAAGA